MKELISRAELGMFGELSPPGAAWGAMAWGGGWGMLRRVEKGERKD